jgi:hypothetical protein
MSHKTELATKLNNGHYLKKALDKLGLKYKEAKPGTKLRTNGHYGVHEEVDILVENQNDAIGFKKAADGTYTAVGDFFGLKLPDGRSADARTLTGELTAHSKEAELNDRLQNMGFISDNSQRKENREFIEVVFTRLT